MQTISDATIMLELPIGNIYFIISYFLYIFVWIFEWLSVLCMHVSLHVEMKLNSGHVFAMFLHVSAPCEPL